MIGKAAFADINGSVTAEGFEETRPIQGDEKYRQKRAIKGPGDVKVIGTLDRARRRLEHPRQGSGPVYIYSHYLS